MLNRRILLFARFCAAALACMAITDASHAFSPEAPLAPAASPALSSNANPTVIGDDYFDPQETGTSGRPRGLPFGLAVQWINGPNVDLTTYDTSLKLPLLFGFESPPPILKIGFGYTEIDAADSFELPPRLYEYSLGLSWVRKFNDRWAVRSMLGVALATDNLNVSSDAWRFRGGVFAIYEFNPRWTWTFGAIALGRDDLPVLPAIGAVWVPNETTRVDLLLPNPRANFLLSDNGQRQQWVYFGGGLNGNTWGFEAPNVARDDTLTYGDVRAVAGWESRPSAPASAPYVPGRKYNFEVGYAFSRDFEFEDESDNISLDNALMIRASTSF